MAFTFDHKELADNCIRDDCCEARSRMTATGRNGEVSTSNTGRSRPAGRAAAVCDDVELEVPAIC